ncbi:hypothetical protein Tco_0492906 [Tanacetum coccineum]
MLKKGNPEILLQGHVVVDSGCSSHMTGNKAYLSDYEDFNRGFVAFGSDPKGDKITGKVEDVPLATHEKSSESSPKDNDVQDLEDVANKETKQDLQDELEKMVTQELAAKAMDDAQDKPLKERGELHPKEGKLKL